MNTAPDRTRPPYVDPTPAYHLEIAAALLEDMPTAKFTPEQLWARDRALEHIRRAQKLADA